MSEGLSLADLAPERRVNLAASPGQALLDLAGLVRSGRRALAVMTVDLHADRALDDPRASFESTLAPTSPTSPVATTRVIGPASGGVVDGPGRVALITAIGPLAPRIAAALGPELGLAVDLGLAWDVTADELVDLITDAHPIDTLGLALPPAAYAALGPALRRAQGRLALFATARGPLATALARYGVAPVDDLGALVRATATRPADRPRGRRVAVVTGTGPLAALVPAALSDAGLELARLSPATRAHLESELPAATRYAPLVRIPGATARHVELALESLRSDLFVEHALAIDVPGHPPRDPSIEARHLAALATAARALTAGPSPLPPEPAPTPRAAALIAAQRLMRRTTLDRAATCQLLVALEPTLTPTPAFPVASLAAAVRAARTVGYPVLLGATRIADDEALATAWEALLGTIDDAVQLQGAVPTTALTYHRDPLPHATIGDDPVALPARQAELDARPAALRRALIALSRLACGLPEIARLDLAIAADGALVDARATLAEATAAEGDTPSAADESALM